MQAADFPNIRIALLAAALFISGSPALADSDNRLIVPICHTHDEIAAKLLSDFSEQKLGLGISGDGTLLELFIARTGTFTIVKTTAKGVSCIVDFGDDWQMLNPPEMTDLSNDKPEVQPTPF